MNTPADSTIRSRLSGTPGAWTAPLLLCLVVGLLFSLSPASAQTPDTIATVAGSGTSDNSTDHWGYEGDGGPATSAKMRYPYGVVVAPNGTFYISDYWNSVIRRVDPDGIITTYAGIGLQAGNTGDGGPATQAKLNSPRGLALDAEGNLYIAESYPNHRIRKVDFETKTISTFAGTGAPPASFDPGDGNLATTVPLGGPFDVAIGPDGDALYIAETDFNRIRKVDLQTRIITTIAGMQGSQGFSGDGEDAIDAQFNHPYAIAFGPDDLLYIADTRNHRIRRINADSTIETVVGSGIPDTFSTLNELPEGWSGDLVGDHGPAEDAQLEMPYGLAFDPQGRMLISDSHHYRIRRVEADETITTVAGNGKRYYSGDGGHATQAALHLPFGIDVDQDGSLYLAQSGSHRIRKVQAPFTPASTLLAEVTAS